MSSAGHVLDMIKRFQQNRNMLKGKKFYDKVMDNYVPERKHLEYREKKIKPEQVNAVKIKMKEKIIRDKRRGVLYSLFIMILLLLALLLAIIKI